MWGEALTGRILRCSKELKLPAKMARGQRAVPGASEPSRLLAGFKGDGRPHLGRAALPGESAAPPESANASPHPRCPPPAPG